MKLNEIFNVSTNKKTKQKVLTLKKKNLKKYGIELDCFLKSDVLLKKLKMRKKNDYSTAGKTTD